MSGKIVVPEEMLKASQEAAYVKTGSIDDRLTATILEAALLWLSENPIVPTDEQVEKMKSKLILVYPHWGNIVCEWQRRMFLAEEAFDPSLGGVLSGRTFTREQFDAIKEYLEGAVYG